MVKGARTATGRDTQVAARRHRARGVALLGLVAATVAAAITATLLALRTTQLAGSGPWRVETAVELGVTAVGALVAAWLAASAGVALVCSVARLAGATWRTGERLVQRWAPAAVRRVLVLAIGAGVGLAGATGATAAVPDAPDGPVAVSSAPSDLGWAPTAHARAGTPVAPVTAPASASASTLPRTTTTPGTTTPPGATGTVAGAPTAGAPGVASGASTGPTAPADATATGSTSATVAGPVGAPAPGPTSPAAAPVPAWAQASGGTAVPGAVPATTATTASGSASTGPSTDPSADPTNDPSADPTTGATSATWSSSPTHAAVTSDPATPHSPADPGDPGAPGASPGAARDPETTRAATTEAQAGTVTVQPGDTLWSIAARHLPGDADDATIARTWPRWYAANLAVVGDDPDVLVPGQVLVVPATDGTVAR